MKTDCPFCFKNWDKLTIVKRAPYRGFTMAVVVPLNPVTEGHVLVISADHWRPTEFDITPMGPLAEFATRYIKANEIDANLIWNCGAAATQTVDHTHLHIVPRVAGDGLKLPWTDQKKGWYDKVNAPRTLTDEDEQKLAGLISVKDRARAFGLNLTDEQIAKLEAYQHPQVSR